MPKPEIARRCPSCGISIRVRASFCPECGKQLPTNSDTSGKLEDAGAPAALGSTSELSAPTSESAPTMALDSFPSAMASESSAATTELDSSTTMESDSSAPTIALDSYPSTPASESANTMAFDPSAATMPLDSSGVTRPLVSKDTMPPRSTVSTRPPAFPNQPRQATVGMGQRVGTPRVVIDHEGRNRVEKFRQMSNAVIDEAAYDPSLRFVLVSALLFILFLVLLLLSELIK